MKNTIIDELLERAFCEGYEYAQREFTKWDDSDDIRRMKDSDILAEEYKKDKTKSKKRRHIARGATVGGVSGAILGALLSKNKVAGVKKGLALGALSGGLLGEEVGHEKTKEERENTKFHNERLAYAKRQALRRERKDWKQQMTGRDGYSF